MIAWAAGAALAGSYAVDLLVLPVTTRTNAFSASFQELGVDGRTLTTPASFSAPGLGGRGLQLELGAAGDRNEDLAWVLALGYRQDDPRWVAGPFEVHPVAREVRAQFGYLVFPERSREVKADVYIAAYTGVQTAILSAQPFTRPQVSPGWVTSLAIGAGTRNTGVRMRVEGRVELIPRFDSYQGTAQLPLSTFSWTYSPGQASASILFGMGFAGRDRS